MASMARPCVLRHFAISPPTSRFVSTSIRPITSLASTTTRQIRPPFGRSPTHQTSLEKKLGLITRVAAFHATSRREILPPLPQRLNGTANEAALVPHADSMHGRYHWDLERFVSIALIPVTLAPFAGGSLHPVMDATLCILIIAHSHIGFQSCIIDYIPPKRVPKARFFFDWLLRIGSLVVAYGFYEFETTDVGLVEGVKKIWHA